MSDAWQKTAQYYKAITLQLKISESHLVMSNSLPLHGLYKSMEFSRPEYRSGWPFPSLGDLPYPGIEPRSPALQAGSLPAESPGKPPIKKKIFFLNPTKQRA